MMPPQMKADRIHDLLYSCEDREEICTHVVELEDLCVEAASVLFAWGQILNTLCHRERDDYDHYPMKRYEEIAERMSELGIPRIDEIEPETTEKDEC